MSNPEGMTVLPAFRAGEALTMGVELELQLVNLRDFDLTRGAESLLCALARSPRAGNVKPEITESMIEVNSEVHTRHDALLRDLAEVRGELCAAADKLNIGIAGGGAHPFHHWAQRRIFPTERFSALSELYGYLAKQFTVFGQHIHIGCSSADQAIHLTRRMTRFVPHLIALAAASPFSQGEDTAFDSSRLHAVSAFPLSGHMPSLSDWQEFTHYFERMAGFGIVHSMKDFYWDVRPKPEFGTIEIRVCDTPLDIETAAAIAAFAQTLCAWLSDQRGSEDDAAEDSNVYDYNRFQACRFGFAAQIADVRSGGSADLRSEILAILTRLQPSAERLGSERALELLHARASEGLNDAQWMRGQNARNGSLADVVRAMCGRWCGRKGPPPR
jgi:glutamate---cysteine ligase / carboxylate-amine ligase